MVKSSSSSSGPRIISGEVQTFRHSTSLRCSVHLNWKLLLLLLLVFLALSIFFKCFYNDNSLEEEGKDAFLREDVDHKLGGLFSANFGSDKKSTTNFSHFDPLKIPFPLPKIAERPDAACHWHLAYLQNLTSLVWNSNLKSKLKQPELITLLTSLSTLRTMNLNAEFNTTLMLLSTTLSSSLSKLESMTLSAAVTRVLAPLLSNYALAERSSNQNNSSADQARWFKDQAKTVGTAIHSLSKQLFSLPKRTLSRRPQPASVNYRLGEVIHLLEFLYYDAVMGSEGKENSGYSEEMKDTLMRLTRIHRGNHSHNNNLTDHQNFKSRLYMSTLNQSGWTSSRSSLFGPSAPFYWTLINVHCLLYSPFQSQWGTPPVSTSQDHLIYLQLFTSAIDDALAARLITTNVDGWTYAQSIDFAAHNNGTLDGQMDSSACGLGGLLALGAWALNRTIPTTTENQNKSAQCLSLAVNLTETCHELTQRSMVGSSPTSGLLPDRALFLPDGSIQLAQTATHLQ